MADLQIDKAASIQGWMSWDELAWLADQATRHQFIIELGSYAGRSTRVLADNTPGVVIAVDDWRGCRNEGDKDLVEQEDLFPTFVKNLEDHIEKDKVIIQLANHEDALLNFGEVPDFVFIDGDHRYASVKRDIQAWYPLIKEGGIIAGHDSGFADVDRAVRELLPEAKKVHGTTIWFAVIE